MTEKKIWCDKVCYPKYQARVLYRRSLMCAKKTLSHWCTNLLEKSVFLCRISYFLHQLRAATPWYLSSQYLACHTQRSKVNDSRDGLSSSWKRVCHTQNHRNNHTCLVWLWKVPWSLRGWAQAEGHEDLLLQLWLLKRRWEVRTSKFELDIA